jgi:hypothetical protein
MMRVMEAWAYSVFSRGSRTVRVWLSQRSAFSALRMIYRWSTGCMRTLYSCLSCSLERDACLLDSLSTVCEIIPHRI